MCLLTKAGIYFLCQAAVICGIACCVTHLYIWKLYELLTAGEKIFNSISMKICINNNYNLENESARKYTID